MVLLVCLLVSAPLDVSFKGPKDPAQITEYHPQSWEVGATAWVVKDTRLLSSATADDATASGVPFGSTVTIVQRSGELVQVVDRYDYWYEVDFKNTRGFIFGGDLTPVAFEGDFDGDKKPELITVSWTPAYKIRVRYSKRGVLKELELQPGGQQFTCCGGTAHVELIARKDAGATLLKIATDGQACGDTATALVSLSGGEPRVALDVAGLSDPPNYSRVTFEFGVNALIATRKSWEGDSPADEARAKISRDVYAFKKGVYVKQSSSPK